MSDTQLTRLKAGDPKTQREFWHQMYGEVYAISSNILGKGPDAGEVAGDVMSDFLFNYVHVLSSKQTIFSYLRIMTARRAIRYRAKKKPYISIEEVEVVDNTNKTPEDVAYYTALVPRLVTCMDELTPKAQQAIRLRYGRHMTNENIGNLLGGSKQYIGRLLSQSLVLLRNCLNDKSQQPKGPKSQRGLRS